MATKTLPEAEVLEIDDWIQDETDPALETNPVPDQEEQSPRSRFVYVILGLLVIYSLGIYGYGIARYRGYWSEGDTLFLAYVLRFSELDNSVLDQHIPYSNGLTFQALSMYLLRTGGISIQVLQLFIYPMFAALLPFAAFSLYRVFTNNDVTALFATLLLFTQPDFLFVTWRGSHEKFTWYMALLLLFLLARSFTSFASLRRLAPLMITFYFLLFAFISTNAFFASSFITALAWSFVVGIIFLTVRHRLHRQYIRELTMHVWRLLFITLACGIVLYLFFFFIYPPALGLLRAFGNLVDALFALFLASDVDSSVQAVNAYDYVYGSYVDPRLYLILAGSSFVIAAFSGLVWLIGAVRYVLKPELTRDELPRILLWSVYAGFAFQLLISVFTDQVGTVGANIQVRLFTPMMLFAIPLAAIGLHGILRRLRPPLLFHVGIWLTAPALVLVSILSASKMINEPIVNNNWLFTTESDRRAVEWLYETSDDPVIWEGLTFRQRNYLRLSDLEVVPGYFRSGEVPDSVQYYIYSELERAMWLRANQPLLYLDQEYRVYDNGDTQIYYRRPETYYQR